MSPKTIIAISDRIKAGYTKEEIKAEFLKVGYTDTNFESLWKTTQNSLENKIKTEKSKSQVAEKTNSIPVSFPGYWYFLEQGFSESRKEEKLILSFVPLFLLLMSPFSVFLFVFYSYIIEDDFILSFFDDVGFIYIFIIIFSFAATAAFFFYRLQLTISYHTLHRRDNLMFKEQKNFFKYRSVATLNFMLAIFLSLISFVLVFLFTAGLVNSALYRLFLLLVPLFVLYIFLVILFLSLSTGQNKTTALNLALKIFQNYFTNFSLFLFLEIMLVMGVALIISYFSLSLVIPIVGYIVYILTFANALFFEYFVNKNLRIGKSKTKT